MAQALDIRPKAVRGVAWPKPVAAVGFPCTGLSRHFVPPLAVLQRLGQVLSSLSWLSTGISVDPFVANGAAALGPPDFSPHSITTNVHSRSSGIVMRAVSPSVSMRASCSPAS